MSDQRTPQDHAELFSRYSWVRKRHRLDERRRRFMRVPWAGGAVLMLCVAAAMLLANLPSTAMYYEHVLSTDLSLLIESPDHVVDLVFPRDMNVEKLINDGLMVIFFFVVGLEIKREIVCGELSTARKAILPVMAAAGGMLAPALIYLAFNHGTPAAHGWGIPTATDIAFAIGILSLMGDRVPVSLKIFLTALAVVDDLGAILVIAIFYGGAVKWGFLFLALAIMAGLYGLNRLGETRISYFLIPAFVVWGLFYYSGIHATLSGVAMAMIIPMRPRYSKPYFFRQLHPVAGAGARGGRTFSRRRAALLPATHEGSLLQLDRHELPSGRSACSVRHVHHHADLRVGQRGGAHRSGIPRYFPLFF